MSPKTRPRVAPTARYAKSLLRSGGAATRPSKPNAAHLRQLIEEATVDCYNEEEELTSLLTMIQEHLQVPFETTVLGATVASGQVVNLVLRRLMVGHLKRPGKMCFKGQVFCAILVSLYEDAPCPKSAIPISPATRRFAGEAPRSPGRDFPSDRS